jgi:enoyl-CoA hydratase/carnithine racemase
MTTGHRFTGPEALDAGLVDGIADESDVLARAIAKVSPLAGKHAGTLSAVKSTMYADVVRLLDEAGA